MAFLVGREYCKVDANGRFKFPASHKKQLQSVIGEGFVIRESVFDKCLELWPSQEFEKEVAELNRRLNQYNVADRLITRRLMAANPVSLDTSDRLLIPADMRASRNITKDIVLIPKVNIIEIWDIDEYNTLTVSDDEVVALISERLGQLSQDQNHNL